MFVFVCHCHLISQVKIFKPNNKSYKELNCFFDRMTNLTTYTSIYFPLSITKQFIYTEQR